MSYITARSALPYLVRHRPRSRDIERPGVGPSLFQNAMTWPSALIAGDQVGTPVATMGIRGTAVILDGGHRRSELLRGRRDGRPDDDVLRHGRRDQHGAQWAELTPTANFNGAATLTVTTTDNGNTGSGGSLSDLYSELARQARRKILRCSIPAPKADSRTLLVTSQSAARLPSA